MLSETSFGREGDHSMGIGGVTSTNSVSGMQMMTAASTDQKSRSIQNEITTATQQMQKLSSKEDLSVNEKANEQKNLKKEIASLNTELKQHQDELRRSQKREIMLAKLQEDQGPAKEDEAKEKIQSKETSSEKADEKNLPADKQQTGHQGSIIFQDSDGTVILKESNQGEKLGVDTANTPNEEAEEDIAEKETKSADDDRDADAGLSRKEVYAMASADASVQQANGQGSVIARTRDGIAVLKGEMNQDEMRGVNTDRKQAELEKMEQQEQNAIAFQSAILGEANRTMQSAAKTPKVTGIEDNAQENAANNAYINALRVSQEEGQAAQQRLFVSVG